MTPVATAAVATNASRTATASPDLGPLRRRRGAQPPTAATLARTYIFRNSEAPRWETRFLLLLPLAHRAARLDFHVRDADPLDSDLIGTTSLPAIDVPRARRCCPHAPSSPAAACRARRLPLPARAAAACQARRPPLARPCSRRSERTRATTR